jgi:hypothetical protein
MDPTAIAVAYNCALADWNRSISHPAPSAECALPRG